MVDEATTNLGTIDALREEHGLSFLSDDEIVDAVQKYHFPDLKRSEVEEKIGYQKDVGFMTPIKSLLADPEMLIPNVVGAVGALGSKMNELSGQDGKVFDPLKNWARDYEPFIKLSDKEQESMFLSKIPRGFGSAIKYMGLRLTPVGYTSMFADFFGSSYNEVSRTNPEWDEDRKLSYSTVQASMNTATEAISTDMLLKSFSGVGYTTMRQAMYKGALMKSFVGSVKKYFLSEGTQEGIQQVFGNLIDKLYGIDRKLFDGVLESIFIGGVVGGTMGGSSAMLRNNTTKRFKSELDAIGFTPEETSQLMESLYSVLDKEFEASPENVLASVAIFKEAGDNVRKETNIKKEISRRLVDGGISQDEAVDTVSAMDLAQLTNIKSMEKKQETAETLEQYESLLNEKKIQAIEAGTDLEVADKAININSAIIGSTAKYLGVTKYDILSKLNQRIVNGEKYDAMATKAKEAVKADISDAVATPEQDTVEADTPGQREIKDTLSYWIGKEVEYEGIKGTLIKDEEGTLMVEGKKDTIEIPTKETDAIPADVGVKVAKVPAFKVSNFGENIAIGGKDYSIDSFQTGKDGKASMTVTDEKGQKKTYRGQAFVLDVEIARNKLNTREQYDKLSEKAKAKEDLSYTKDANEVGLKENKPGQYDILRGLIDRIYTPEIEGLLGAIGEGKKLSELNRLKVMDTLLGSIDEIDRRKFNSPMAKKLKKIFYEQLEVMESEHEEQGADTIIKQRRTSRSFKAFSEEIKQKRQEAEVAKRKLSYDDRVKYETDLIIEEQKDNLIKRITPTGKNKKPIFLPGHVWSDWESVRSKFPVGSFTKKKNTNHIEDVASEQGGLDRGSAYTLNEFNNILDATDKPLTKAEIKVEAELRAEQGNDEEAFYKQQRREYELNQKTLKLELIEEAGLGIASKKVMEADQEVLEKVIKDRGVDATGAELDSFIETLYATYANAMTQEDVTGKYVKESKEDGGKLKHGSIISGEDTLLINIDVAVDMGLAEKDTDEVSPSSMATVKVKDYMPEAIGKKYDANNMKSISKGLLLKPKTDTEEARLATIKKNKETRERLEESIEAKYGQDQTPEAKAKLFDTTQEGENFELFNKRNAEIKGSFDFIDGEGLIKLYNTADPSTLIHELSHSWLHLFSKMAPELIVPLMEWTGTTNINDPKQYKRLQEAFADAFVDNYLLEGKAPTPELQTTFDKFSAWLGELFKSLKRRKINLKPEVLSFFDEMLTGFKDTDATDIQALEAEITSLFQEREELVAKVKRITKATIGSDIKKDIKDVQTQLIKHINSFEDITKDERWIFINNVKEANSERTRLREIKKVTDRALRKIESKQKHKYVEAIDKLLKKPPTRKQGSRTVGIYDYESNKLFIALREHNKLKQVEAQAKLDAFEADSIIPNELEKIERRLISMKATGMGSSIELMSQVQGDILNSKRLGKQAVDNADFIKKMQKFEDGKAIIDAIKKNGVTRKNITKKLEGMLASGIGNQYTFLNILTNGEIANKYNMEISESDKIIGMSKMSKSISNEAVELLGLKNDRAYKKWILETSKKQFNLVDKNKIPAKLSIQDIMHIYLGIQNNRVRKAYNKYYGLDETTTLYKPMGLELNSQIITLIENLSEEELAYADMLQRKVQDYYSDLNAVHIRETGLDLNIPENYFPMKSEFEPNFVDDIKQQGETVSAQKGRAKGFPKPLPTNATTMALRYVHDAEHKKNISEKYVDFKRVFNSNDSFDIGEEHNVTIKSLITDSYGEFAFKTLNNLIDSMSISESSKKYNMFNSMASMVLNNWTIGKIALNPTVYNKQLVSVANYAENMPAGKWALGFTEALAHPKKTWDYMMKLDFVEARFAHGNNEVLHSLIKQSEGKGGVLGQNWVDFLTLFTRTGDIMAIIYGGYPYIQHLKSQGLSAEEVDVKFREATLGSQQSPQASSSSDLQNYAKGNAFLRTLTVFKNTPSQYARKQINASYQLARGEITKAQWAKTMAIYTLIAPALYAFAGTATKAMIYGDDFKDKWFEEMLMSLAISPWGSIPLIADISRFIYMKATGKKVWKVLNNPVYGDIEFMARSLTDSNITGKDLINALAVTTEMATAVPTTQLTRIVNKNIERFSN